VIVERPGATNLYFVAWQGKPLGGTSHDIGHHDPRCPLRHPRLAAQCASRGADGPTAPDKQEGSEIPDTLTMQEGSGPSDPQGSEISDGGGRVF
jgi:hypothetical protein